MDAEQIKKITGYFIAEAREHLEAIAQSLENFQATVDDPEQIQEIYRGAHSIKGGAAMLELESIRVTAHRLEDYFKFLKSSPLTVDATLTDLISNVYNALDTLVNKLEETLSLPEEFAKTVIGKVEPLFDRISGHLEKLATGKTTVDGSTPSLPQALQVEVLNALAEIGELQNQGDSPERRAHIQSLCRHLAKLEQSSTRREWTHFLEIAQTAIAYPKNNYSTTARYIVRDLKEAVAHLVAGEGSQIASSRELQNLARQVAPLTTSEEISTATANELNDLADLFEEDSLDFAETWQEEVLYSNNLDSNVFIAPEDSSFTDTDFGELFDTETPGGSVDADPDLKHELEDLFGGDWAEEATELIDSQSDRSAESQSDGDLLAFTSPSNSDSANPAANFDSLDNLFGEGFSFEEDNLAGAGEFAGESTAFSTAKTNREPASISQSLDDDLNKDLDDIFYDVDSNGDADGLLASDSFALDSPDRAAETAPPNIAPPLPQTPEKLPEASDWEDMSDLLDISTAAPPTDTEFELEDFDPFETIVQDEAPIGETVSSQPDANPHREAIADDEFNALLSGEDDGLDGMDDLEAFLSGQTPEMAFGDPSHPQPRKNSQNQSQAITPEFDEVLATPTAEAGDNIEITISSLEADAPVAAERDDDFIAFIEGDDNMTDRKSELTDLDALLENIPETAISESISESSTDEFADLGLFPLDEGEPSETALDDLFAMDAGELSVQEMSSELELEDLFAEEANSQQAETDNLDNLLRETEETFAPTENDIPEDDLAALLDIESEPENGVLSLADTNAIDDLLGETEEIFAPTEQSASEDDLAALLDIESEPENEVLSLADANTIDDLLGETGEAFALTENDVPEDDLAALLDIESEPENEVLSLADANTIDDLLGETEEILTPPKASPSEDDLAALLDIGSEPENKLLSLADTNTIDDLLGETEEILTPPKASPSEDDLAAAIAETAPSVEENAPTLDSDLNYYDRLDELEALLEKPPLSAKDLHVVTTFTELESLLETQPVTSHQSPVTSHQSPVTSFPETQTAAPQAPEEDFDDVEAMLREAQQQAGEIPLESKRSQRPTRSRTNKPKVEASLKVPVKQMDNLSNLVGELVVNRNSLEGDEERLRQFLDSLMHQVQNLSDVGGRMQDLYERSLLENALLRSRREYHAQKTNDFAHPTATTDADNSSFDELEMDSFSKFHELAQETIEMIVRVRESASDIQFLVDDIDQVARTLRQVTSQLQEGLTKSRMIPFGNTASRLPLAVRRIAPQLNKQAHLELEGQETLIDKMILEHLSDPLTHLVNNALTHGIEAPEVRLASGKSQIGHIKVSSMQQGNQTVISVSDDGGGIDPERVKQKAIQKGLIDRARAKRLSRLDVYDLLFHPGFSTKDQADNFAGRGVGLDVVRTSINEIRGAVSIDSKLGKGTTFTIRLPLTLSICKALCCVSENSPISFPLDGVEDMIDLPHRKLQRNAQGQMCVPWRDSLLPYSHLSELLSYNRRIGRSNLYGGKREENVLSVVVLRGSGSHIAVGVDQVVGEQEIVIKQLYGPIPKPAGIAGATVQGDGKIMAIADVLELIEISEGRIRKDMGSTLWETVGSGDRDTNTSSLQDESIVLIVDDSITVRELLSMSFSKAGYRVEQARDGQDAWDKLRSGMPCDIVFCDIEMPRVDGLEFLGRVQKDEELCDIPVAMLTSRGADRHRKVAAELGASGYFTKPYLEEVLLDAAERMIDGAVLLEGSTRKVREVRPKKHPEPVSADPPTLIQASETMIIQPKVLIIDDSVTVRSLLSMTFENAGYHVEQARDGKEAWEKLRGGLLPDLALCDIEMPRLDGLELLGKIYEDEELKRIPVAMLTSRGAERHRKVAAERGASGYFTKPYVEQELLAAADRIRNGEVLLKNSVRQSGITASTSTVTSHQSPVTTSTSLSASSHQAPVTHQQPAPSPSPEVRNPQPPTHSFDGQPKVLIIDDSVTVRSLLSMTFEKAGYHVEQARDGKEALDKLQGGLNPHVVFCDIEMPKMDGLKLIATLQDDEELNKIPVAMLTSRGAKKHQIAAAERGAKGYFTKPYVEDVLLDAAQRLMQGEVLLKVEA
ncbi:MAG: response regulator [Cyanobacteria bacterium P01_E01_bin.42]